MKRELLLEKPPDKNKKIGFVFSPQLGDSLISMVVAHNLRRNGYDVTVFSDHMFSMRHWFANDKINPYPEKSELKSILSSYDALFCVYSHDLIGDCNLWHPQVVALDNSPLIKKKQLVVDTLVNICREDLHLIDLVRVNDLTPPENFEHHKHKNRIIIHPTSRQDFRSWPMDKFIRLAKKFQQLNYEPVFMVSTDEYQEWGGVEQQGIKVKSFSTLDQVASYIYESGWFIGNDSGLGHLASNLGLHTVTLSVRPGLTRLWRPSWTSGIVILPPAWLVTRPLKEKFWKNFISVNKVLKICQKQNWTG